MAYEPTAWKSGDVVSTAKLNKLENGVANAVLIVHADVDGKLDKTWAEMRNAYFAAIVFDNGLHVYVDYPSEYEGGAASWSVVTVGGVTYTASTQDGYPVSTTN